MKYASAAATVLFVLTGACSKTPEPTPTSPPDVPTNIGSTATATGAKTAAPAKPATVDLGWDAPASWESVPNPNQMRKATYKIKRADGDLEDAELSISLAGGTVDMNIKRWASQFEQKAAEEAKPAERKVGDLKVTVVELRGTFTGSGMPGMPAGAPKPNYAMLGAIVETPAAAMWFFKLTGPDKTVTQAKPDFDKFLDSLRLK